jgi:microcystin-dependent protein
MPKPWSGDYAGFMRRLLNGEIKPVRLREDDDVYEEPEDMIPVGGLYLSAVDTNPGLGQLEGGLGYGQWSRYAAGRCLVGVDDGNPTWAAGNMTGSITATPQGSCSAPTFTGAALPSHTHSYTQVPNHVHVETAQGGTTASTTGTHLMTSAATGGSARNAATSTANPTGGVATANTNGPSATLTPSGTCSAPTFTGQSMSIVQPSIAVFVWRRVG